jgi:hypothetical protein
MTIKGAPRGSYKGVLGTHLVGQQSRSSHLGYDCYLTGSANEGTGVPGKVRMVLRPNRLSPRITEATRTILPQEMWWPQRNHSGAHGCIDAVLTQDSKSMEMWKRTWPNHAFGFEDFLVWCQRAAANGIQAPRTGTLDGIATHLSSNVPRSHHTAPQFPVGTELADERVLIRKLDQDGYQVRIYVAKFRDRTSALRVDVVGDLADNEGRVLLGRAYVDLVDDRIWQVIEHHPGNCRALDLPAGLIYQVLGVKAPATAAQQAIRQDERPPERQLTPRQKAVEVGMKAAELNGPAAATLGDMGPLQTGPARMEELRTTNRRTRGGIMPPPVREGMYGADLPAPEPLPVDRPLDESIFPGPSRGG